MTKTLGIETTCDETAAAVVADGRVVLSSVVASQAKLHEKYGGIVPEVASRKHLEMLPVVVDEALKKAKISINDIDAVAVAKEPGLPTALSVGYGYASGLALGNDLPLVDVNHLEAHISGIWLVEDKKDIYEIPYPFLCLLVSGGHTELRLITDEDTQRILGKSVDDASGEAFDKVARILGLGYPGGPIIDKLSKEGDEQRVAFPRPMADSGDFNFSFSGLKTAVLREVKKLRDERENYKSDAKLYEELCNNLTADMAASFQEAVVDVLVQKTMDAAEEVGVSTITMAGGVSANSRLREKLGRECDSVGFELFYPEIRYCVDNAAMIGGKGKLENGRRKVESRK